MILLHGDKSYEQFLEELNGNMKITKAYQLMKPKFLRHDGLVGNINGNKFWAFLFSSHMAVRPYRVLFAEIHAEERGIMIKGSFRYPLLFHIQYLLAYMIFFSIIILNRNYFSLLLFSVLFFIFYIGSFLFGFLFGKKSEKDTVECIKKILMESTTQTTSPQ